MTPTISGGVKQKLKADDFDCGFRMLTHITALFQPTGDGEFMRLTKEYYSLRYGDYRSMTDYLTTMKLLEERIRATKVVLTDDKQTLICLAMSLPEHLQYLTRIWAVTPEMTAEKARTMLLEEERKGNGPEHTYGFLGVGVAPGAKNTSCKSCGKTHGGLCWKEHPEEAPDWLKEKWEWEKRGTKRKRTGTENKAAEAGIAWSS